MLRKQLLLIAEFLVNFGLLDRARVAPIRSGLGHVNLANALLDLGQLLRGLPEHVKAKTPLTSAMLERAGQVADELHLVLGGKIHGDPSTPGLTRNVVRARAWTLMIRAYAECRRAIRFIDPSAVDEVVPSLYKKCRRRVVERAVETPAEPEALLAGSSLDASGELRVVADREIVPDPAAAPGRVATASASPMGAISSSTRPLVASPSHTSASAEASPAPPAHSSG